MPTNIDPSTYGARQLPYTAPEPTGSVGVSTNDPTATRDSFPASGLMGTDANRGALASQSAGANAAEANTIQAVGAAITGWSVVSAYEAVTKQSQARQPGYSGGDALNYVPFQLDDSERKFISEAVNPQDTESRIRRVQDGRIAMQAASGNAIATFLTAAVDPGMLAMDAAGLGLAHMARLGKVAAGTAAAAGNAALGAVQATVDPNVQAKDVAINAMLSGLGTALAFRGNKGFDPDFPTSDLQRHLDEFQGPPKPSVSAIPTDVVKQADGSFLRLVTPEVPAVFENVVTPGTKAVFRPVEELVTLPANLAGAKPRYAFGSAQYDLQFASDIDRASYITAQASKSAKNEEYLQFVMKAMGWSSEQVISHGNKVKAAIRAQAKGGNGGTLNLAEQVPVPRTSVLKEVRPATPDTTVQVERTPATPAVWEPWTPTYNQVGSGGAAVRGADPSAIDLVPAEVTRDAGKSFMSKLEWSVSKSMGKIDAGIRDLLVSSTDLTKTSVEDVKRANEAHLRSGQYKMENLVLDELANRGAGLASRLNPFSSKAMDTQKALTREIKLELLRREELTRQGRAITFDNVNPAVKAIADAHDSVMREAASMMKNSKVLGAEALETKPGWFSRRWNSAKMTDLEQGFMAKGMTAEKAHQQVVKLIGFSIRRANPSMDAQTAYDVGASIVARAKRKGYFEDSVFETNQGNKVMAEVRDALKDSGITGDRAKRVMQILEGHNDEVGKPGFLKHRIDLEYKAGIIGPDGKLFQVHELIDDNVLHTADRYIEGVSAQSAWAQMGVATESQLDDLRARFVRASGGPETQAAKDAAALFDNVVASIDGRPQGVNLTDGWRMFQQLNRMVSLRNSGVYQLSEYATAMAEFGVLKTLKYAASTMSEYNFFRSGKATADEASRLGRIIGEVGHQDVRIRPYIHRFEDNFEVGANEAAHLRIQAGAQLVPYLNGMKFVHHHQATMVGRLIEDRVVQAAKGNVKAQAALERYGIKGHVLEKLRHEVNTNGTSIDKWSSGAWEAVRPSMAKMMDESVLRARIGDMPAFAQFDPVGKFVFSFRSFILTAHNKLLVGRSEREGMLGLATLLAYQYPLAVMSTSLQNQLSGKKELTDKELAAKSVANMGSIGLLSEPVAIVTGERRSAGAPGIILADRVVKAAGLASQAAFTDKGDAGKAAAAALDLVPLLAIPYPVQHMAEHLKTKE